jgi:hypothetical protein
MKSGNLNFLEPPGPLQACNRTALPFTFTFTTQKKVTPYGVLVRMVCEGKSGYICNMEIYAVLVHTVVANTTNVSDWHHLQLRLLVQALLP